MAISKQEKLERIEFRLSSEDKDLLQKAQLLSGHQTISAFIVGTLRDKAMQIIKAKEKILESEKDKEVFFQSILKDVAPNAELLNAAQRYLDKLD